MGDHRPYLEGAESARLARMPPGLLAEKLAAFDVVSLDVFDTMVFRPFSTPVDLFMVLGERLDFTDFYRVRIEAERRARSLRKKAVGDTEADLGEIYACVERETGIPREVGMEAEIAAEADFAFANPYMQQVYASLRARGKTIVFTSDMYLGESAIRRILNACGYEGDARIFVSSAHRCTKRGGKLFSIVKKAMGDGLRYAHVGDNVESDVRSAEQQGFAAVHYANVNQEGNPWRAPGMSELVGSLYRGTVNAHLYQGLGQRSVPYEYGFVYGGLYVLGFAQWVKAYCARHGITKVVFLSRDGAIYRRVFRMLEGHQASAYVYWSRLPTICLEAERDRHNFLRRGIRERVSDVRPMTVADTLSMLRLSFLLEKKTGDTRLKPSTLVTGENVDALEQIVLDSWDEVLAVYARQESAAQAYLQSVISGHRRVAVVDTGWYGSGPLSIKWMVEEKWRLGVHVDCLLAGSNALPQVTLPRIMHGKVHAYLFDWAHGRDHAAFHAHENPNCNNAFFELLTQAPHPSFEAFSQENGDAIFHFGFAAVENYGTIRQIHRGILDFARQYLRAVHKDAYLLRISGHDAYAPFRFVASSPEYFRRFFHGYKLRNTIGEHCGAEDLETLGGLMDRQKVGIEEKKIDANGSDAPGAEKMPPTTLAPGGMAVDGQEDADAWDTGYTGEMDMASKEDLRMELQAVRGMLTATEKRLAACLRRQEELERELAAAQQNLAISSAGQNSTSRLSE